MNREINVRGIEWDEWNREHILKHHVSVSETNEVILSRPYSKPTYKNRIQMIGTTHAGRILSVVVGFVPGTTDVVYPFSSRSATKKERNAYHEWRSKQYDEGDD